MFQKTVAQREKVKLMIGLSGPSGSGKTLSALKMAYGITKDWSKIVMADTENKSALYYAGEMTGSWEHIDFNSNIKLGYHPNNWIALIDFVEKSSPNCEVLILDSITHEWQGRGGCTDLVSSLSKNAHGNTFTPWNTVTPLHNSFIDKMRDSRLHIIATMRAKSKYKLELNEKGKQTPQKVGLKSMQREDTDYEFGIIFDLNLDHEAIVSKDRTGLFMGHPPFVIDEKVGEELLNWTSSGKKAAIPIGYFDSENPDQCARVEARLKEKNISEDTWPSIFTEMHGKPMGLKTFDEVLAKLGIGIA